MKLRIALPTGLTYKMCKRFDPWRMGGAPTIKFVPSSPTSSNKEGNKEPAQVKITISTKVSKYYTVFKEGNTEDVVNLIRTHDRIIVDKKLKENCNVIAALISANKKRLTMLTNKSSRTSDEKREVKEVQEALKEYKTQVKQTQEEAFEFFKMRLDQKIVAEWREIVKQECKSVDYVSRVLKSRAESAAKCLQP